MSFFRAVIYLLIRSKIYQYIAYQRNALIDKILVSEREKLTDGMVRQKSRFIINSSALSVNYISHPQSGGRR